MRIDGAVALVTGANRGIGHAFTEALPERGAAKVYAGVRDPATVTDPRLTPLRLDVTDPAQVAASLVTTRTKAAILDDYQHIATSLADWNSLGAEIKVYARPAGPGPAGHSGTPIRLIEVDP
jgi:NAD(P)-dependent dehydrogenase (short-subunit alcohol dehydrogenase family)